MSKQPGSQYWGTGTDLSDFRDSLDGVKSITLLIALSRRIHGYRYSFRKATFRALFIPTTLIDMYNDEEEVVITPADHLASEDGRTEGAYEELTQ